MPDAAGGVAEQIAELRRQKDKTEEQMQAAVDNDDFDEADRLQTVLADLDTKMAELEPSQ